MASEDSTVAASGRAALAELPPASSNVAASTYEQIRQRILLGVLPPESSLALAELADELGVSTMPVRAALARLTSEGLVRKLRSRVSIVAPLEIEDFEEIQAV